MVSDGRRTGLDEEVVMWEYRVHYLRFNTDIELEVILNEWGIGNWELIWIENQAGDYPKMIFKRKKND